MRAGQEGILAVSLLAAAPTRIAEDVDVRRPEIEALEDVAVARADGLNVLDAALGADRHGHRVNCGRVERGGQADRLGKLGGAIQQHTVERLAPPVVGWNLQARNRASLVHQLRSLLFQRQTGNQIIYALLSGQGGIEIGRVGRRRDTLGRQTRRSNGKSCEHSGKNCEVFHE